MGLCFENSEEGIITGNVLFFRGAVCVGVIYLHYSISIAFQKPFVLFFCSAQLFCSWEWRISRHNPTEKALALPVLCPRCNVDPSAVSVALAEKT